MSERPNGRLLLGLLLIGTGRAAGFAQFGANADAFLASLAPWLALLIVLAGLLAVTGHWLAALTFFLFTLCNLLTPAIMADGLCRLWGRRQYWALYANILNCTQWIMLAAFLVLIPVTAVLLAAGVPPEAATRITVGVLVAYLMWFHWFAARHALQVSRGRAALAMLCVVFGTTLLLEIPALLTGHSSAQMLRALAPEPPVSS